MIMAHRPRAVAGAARRVTAMTKAVAGTIPIFQVDAFTGEPFRGNPAAVCLLSGPRSDRWMAAVAREMNLSETAFLLREGEAWRLRWFTPTVEVDLCGHATLASAWVLFERGLADPARPIAFLSRSGLLAAELRGERVELDFPAKREQPAPAPPGFARALGFEPLYVGRNAFDYLALAPEAETVRRLAPDIPGLKRLPVRGVIVTASSDRPGCDFVSRFFAPAVGVDEDPVTGSAHCCLAPFWGARLGRIEMKAYQASPRGGTLALRLAGERVILAGGAVTVLEGTLTGRAAAEV
jgi:PhzF family phenazine biosynthesis protein